MFGSIKKFFKKSRCVSEVDQVLPEVEEVVIKNKRVALIVGHSAKAKGAKSYNGQTEFDWNRSVASSVNQMVKDRNSGKLTKVFFRDGDLSYREAMDKIADEVSKWNADMSVELHFNSIGDAAAYGCEILVYDKSRNYGQAFEIADKWTDDLGKRFKLRERNGNGVKVLSKGERGHYNLAAHDKKKTPISILIEPTFAGKKTHESERFFEGNGNMEYAVFLTDMICKL